MISDWNKCISQKEADWLLCKCNHFHDTCLACLQFNGGMEVENKCMGRVSDPSIVLNFHSQDQEVSIIELKFVGNITLNIPETSEFDMISCASLHFDGQAWFWRDSSDWDQQHSDDIDALSVSGLVLYWRITD